MNKIYILDNPMCRGILVYTHLNLIHEFCIYAEIQHVAASQIRDAKDLYLLSLSETVGADYIVSGDKDLLVLERHGQTKMIKLMDFKLLCGL